MENPVNVVIALQMRGFTEYLIYVFANSFLRKTRARRKLKTLVNILSIARAWYVGKCSIFANTVYGAIYFSNMCTLSCSQQFAINPVSGILFRNISLKNDRRYLHRRALNPMKGSWCFVTLCIVTRENISGKREEREPKARRHVKASVCHEKKKKKNGGGQI